MSTRINSAYQARLRLEDALKQDLTGKLRRDVDDLLLAVFDKGAAHGRAKCEEERV